MYNANQLSNGLKGSGSGSGTLLRIRRQTPYQKYVKI